MTGTSFIIFIEINRGESFFFFSPAVHLFDLSGPAIERRFFFFNFPGWQKRNEFSNGPGRAWLTKENCVFQRKPLKKDKYY